jgi:hypothetical protein
MMLQEGWSYSPDDDCAEDAEKKNTWDSMRITV